MGRVVLEPHRNNSDAEFRSVPIETRYWLYCEKRGKQVPLLGWSGFSYIPLIRKKKLRGVKPPASRVGPAFPRRQTYVCILGPGQSTTCSGAETLSGAAIAELQIYFLYREIQSGDRSRGSLDGEPEKRPRMAHSLLQEIQEKNLGKEASPVSPFPCLGRHEPRVVRVPLSPTRNP